MKQISVRIINNNEISPGFYKIRLESPYLARTAKPGQFVEVRCSEGNNPLLRRPLGCHKISPEGIEMLYEVVGDGTEILSRKKAGDQIDVIGPLGSGFDIEGHEPGTGSRVAVLVAGGIGVAPLVALAEEVARRKTKIYTLIGACKRSHVLCENDFKRSGAKVMVATEDGSKGKKGLVTDILKDLLASGPRSPAAIYACGPTAMLKAVAKIARGKRITCQVSLEERMACGVGVCLGCPVKVKAGGYKMVCKDGPVFTAEDIAW